MMRNGLSSGVAVVKITPSVGCVKYKAQHIVLAVRIPVFIGDQRLGTRKMGAFAVDFRKRARNWWDFRVTNRAPFEGRRRQGQGQGAGVVQRVWMGVDMWEMRSLVREQHAIGCQSFRRPSLCKGDR